MWKEQGAVLILFVRYLYSSIYLRGRNSISKVTQLVEVTQNLKIFEIVRVTNLTSSG